MLSKLLNSIFLDKEFKEKIKFLKQVSIFAGLDDRTLGKVLNITYQKKYLPDEIIFSEGDIGKALFIVKSGEVIITKQERTIAKLHTGDFFGEMALLEETVRSATAKTTQESEICMIYKVRFDGLIENHPHAGIKIIRNIAKILSSRLRRTDEAL